MLTRRVRCAAAAAFTLSALMGAAAAQDDTKFRRGDANVDGDVNIADPIGSLGCLFLGTTCTKCQDAGDTNDDGLFNVSDSIHVLNWLFSGGRPPPAPGPFDCGEDETADRLEPCIYDLRGCGTGSGEDPTTADVLSRLHYAGVAFVDREVEHEDEGYERPTGDHGPREVLYEPRPGPSFSWNSSVGRRVLLDGGSFEPDLEGAHFHPRGSLESQILTAIDNPCVEPDYYVSAGDRVFGGWPEMTFQAPANAFATKAEARAFLLKVHRAMRTRRATGRSFTGTRAPAPEGAAALTVC